MICVNVRIKQIKRNTVNDAARRIRKKAAGLLFVTLLLCVQGGTFLIL